MDVVLNSPLEALAFDYLSFGLFTLVNNLWTWVAVATAAASFWSLKLMSGGGASSRLKLHSPPPPNDPISNGSPPLPEISQPVTAEEPPRSGPAPVLVGSGSGEFEGDRVTRGMKITLYYYDENSNGGEGGNDDVAAEEETERSGCGGDWWEGVMRMRTGEMGWYRYQDLTELNGNVVRLWDSCRVTGRYCSPSSKSKRCVVSW